MKETTPRSYAPNTMMANGDTPAARASNYFDGQLYVSVPYSNVAIQVQEHCVNGVEDALNFSDFLNEVKERYGYRFVSFVPDYYVNELKFNARTRRGFVVFEKEPEVKFIGLPAKGKGTISE